MLTLSSGKAIQVSQFQNLNANFAQIFFRVYHNHRYKSWDMIIKIWIHIENVYHWAMSILISECQFCTNIFRLQILLAIFTCCLGRVNMFLLKIPPWFAAIWSFNSCSWSFISCSYELNWYLWLNILILGVLIPKLFRWLYLILKIYSTKNTSVTAKKISKVYGNSIDTYAQFFQCWNNSFLIWRKS